MDVDLFSRLYIGCQTRDGNLGEFFRHENQACPPALSDGGNLYLGTKSDLLTCLTQFSGVDSVTTVCPVTSIVILDGAAIIQMLKLVAVKTFEEYTSQIFVPYIMSQFQKALRVDLVWDRYIEGSLKSTARAKRGKGIRRRVDARALIPSNWQDFLRVEGNKTDLFKFLSRALMQSSIPEEKQLVVTDGESVMCMPALDESDLVSISPCSHEEADTRMLLHAKHAAHHGHNKILV